MILDFRLRNPKFCQFSLIMVACFFFLSCETDSVPTADDITVTDASARNETAVQGKGEFSIAQIAIDEGFSELVAALSYVDAEEGTQLVELFLNGTDQYTVFAPTDDAFNDLYAALSSNETPVDDITDLPSALVLDVLLYHVTEGRRAANSVVPPKNPKEIETLLGASFYVNSDASIDAIGNSAQIETPNISASNGIIHVIDAVLLPIE